MTDKLQHIAHKAKAGLLAAGTGTRLLLEKRGFRYVTLATGFMAAVLYVNGMQHLLATPGGQPPARPLSHVVLQPTPPESPSLAAGSNTDDHESTTTINQHSTSVTVNGQTIPVPDNGALHQEITQNGGNTSVDISQSTSGNNSSTSLNIQVLNQSSSQEFND